ncbi:hypothetical protein ACSSS7_004426 [Eimeria intestinalis]
MARCTSGWHTLLLPLPVLLLLGFMKGAPLAAHSSIYEPSPAAAADAGALFASGTVEHVGGKVAVRDGAEALPVLTNTNSIKAPRVMQRAGLIAAIGVLLLAAGGWRLMLRPKEKGEAMKLPLSAPSVLPFPPPVQPSPPPARGVAPYNFQEIEDRKAQLQLKLEKLRELWESKPDYVQSNFAAKLVKYKQPSLPDRQPASVPVAEASFEEALSSLLQPVSEVLRAPAPASTEDGVTLKRRLLLLDASMSAALAYLDSFEELLDIRALRRTYPKLPPLHKLGAQQKQLVTAEVFSRMLEGETDGLKEAEEEQEGPSIPWILARVLGTLVTQANLEMSIKLQVEQAFTSFLDEDEETQAPLADLDIPGGGLFPTASFIGLLKKVESEREALETVILDALEVLEEDFVAKRAYDTLQQIGAASAENQKFVISQIGQAAHRPPAREGHEGAVEDMSLYRTVLSLLE